MRYKDFISDYKNYVQGVQQCADWEKLSGWLSCKSDVNGENFGDLDPLPTFQTKLYVALREHGQYQMQSDDYKKNVGDALLRYNEQITTLNELFETLHALIHSYVELSDYFPFEREYKHWKNQNENSKKRSVAKIVKSLSSKAKQIQSVCDESKTGWKNLSEEIQQLILAGSKLAENIQADDGLAGRIDDLYSNFFVPIMTIYETSLSGIHKKFEEVRETFASFLINDHMAKRRKFKKTIDKMLERVKNRFSFGRKDPLKTQHHGNGR